MKYKYKEIKSQLFITYDLWSKKYKVPPKIYPPPPPPPKKKKSAAPGKYTASKFSAPHPNFRGVHNLKMFHK